VLNMQFPPFMGYVFIAGVVLIALFMTPVKALKDEWFNHAMLPLNLVSNFVDVVSYIRLFAVGTASYAVANSFNTMLGGMFEHWYTAIFASLFLFLAHALNIVLSLMGVMVHGVRLNTLEFSGHVGMQWTGLAYDPFRRQRPRGQDVPVEG
jgi:V/A-type H+/Na+-transporting ATPase subunit I